MKLNDDFNFISDSKTGQIYCTDLVRGGAGTESIDLAEVFIDISGQSEAVRDEEVLAEPAGENY